MITVQRVDDTAFTVTVEGSTRTTHEVTVSPSYYSKLTGGSITPETLIKKSFQFLLDRESNTSTLRSFDLTVISQYFPEYEGNIKKLL